jgi:hypothetical protein
MAKKKIETPEEESMNGYSIYMIGPKLEGGKLPSLKQLRDEDGTIKVFPTEEEARKAIYRKRTVTVYEVIITSVRIVR